MAEDNVTTNIVVNSNFSDLIGDLNKASAALMNFKDKLSVSNKALAQQVSAQLHLWISLLQQWRQRE